MEQFYYTLDYLEGEKNVLADCFSRLPRMEKISVGKKELEMIEKQKGTVVNFKTLKVPSKDDEDEVNFVTTKQHRRIGIISMKKHTTAMMNQNYF